MYKRESTSGHTVLWSPDDQQAAEQAMSDVVARFDSWDGVRYELDDETAAAVQERYDEVISGN